MARTLVVLSALLISAASAASSAQPAFRSGTALVTVPVTVDDRRAADHGPLTAADFQILEDEVPQKVVILSRDRRPASVCIVLDSSLSMASAGRRRLAIAAVNAALAAFAKEDEMALVQFAKQTHVVLPWTPATLIIPPPWDRWKLGPGTSVRDGLKAALALLEQARSPRTIALIVSDGEDNTSQTSLPSIATTRRQSEVGVYAFGVGASAARKSPGADQLKSLVGDSGGRLWVIRDANRAAAAAGEFVDELANQYTLGYAPTRPMDGTYRRLKVTAKSADIAVRHRGGYLATP